MTRHMKLFQLAFSKKYTIVLLCFYFPLVITAQAKPSVLSDKADHTNNSQETSNLSMIKASTETDQVVKKANTLFNPTATYSQETKESMFKPLEWAVKTNLLMDVMGTLALGFEFKTSENTSLEITGGYRLYDSKWPFGASNDSRQRFYYFQPEFRYWLNKTFDGHFFGVHAHYAKYNVGGLTSLFSKSMRENRYEGHLGGLGLSYGYNWRINKHWSLEGTIGLGWSYMDYDKYVCEDCGEKLGSKNRNYFGPTKLGISVVYTIQNK